MRPEELDLDEATWIAEYMYENEWCEFEEALEKWEIIKEQLKRLEEDEL